MTSNAGVFISNEVKFLFSLSSSNVWNDWNGAQR
jgi:hypothetical protein